MEAAVEVWEEIDVLGFTLNARGDWAGIEPGWNQEDLVEGEALRTIERIPDFSLKAAFFVDRPGGEAGQEEVRSADGCFDGARPVLAREKLAAVQPGIEAAGLQILKEAVGGDGIFLHVGHKNFGAIECLKAETTLGVGTKRTETIYFHAGSFGEAPADEAGDLCAGLKTIFGHGPPVSPF